MSGLLVFTVSHNSILEQNVLARFFFFFLQSQYEIIQPTCPLWAMGS